jgi:hypothetical protein
LFNGHHLLQYYQTPLGPIIKEIPRLAMAAFHLIDTKAKDTVSDRQ